MTDKAPMTVEQGDREAAAQMSELHFLFSPLVNEGIRNGEFDHLGTVRAFARHRVQSTAALEEEIKRLREALERIGWHELTAREARDIARTALEGRGS